MFNILVVGPIQINWEEVQQSIPAGTEKVSVKIVGSIAAIPDKPKQPDVEMILFNSSLGKEELIRLCSHSSLVPIVYYTSDLEDAMVAMTYEIDDFVVPSSFASIEELTVLVLQKWIRRKRKNQMIATNRQQRLARNFQSIIASITNSLINSMSVDEVEPRDVNEILRQVGEVLEVDSTSVGFLQNEQNKWLNYLCWFKDKDDADHWGIDHQKANLPDVEEIISLQQIRKGEFLIFSSLDEFPPQAQVDRQQMEKYGISAGIICPLMVSGRVQGFFRLGVKEQDREWQKDEIEFVQVCAEIFTAVMLRWRNIAQLENSVRALRKRNLEITAINQMGIRLQRSRNLSQIFSVVEHFSNDLFPGSVGMLHLCSKNEQSSTVSQWGEWPFELLVEVEQVVSAIEDEKGKIDRDSSIEHVCEMVSKQISEINDTIRPLCIPLRVQNETIGMLSLFFLNGGGEISATLKSLILNFAERIGLAVANLQLREDLHFHSIRDPLTGLYNRRFMEHVFENEMRRTMRRKHPLSVMMMDVDHFKLVNDALGHEVGDQMLTAIAHYLSNRMRKEDVICRYGGDEFVIILPETRVEDAKSRADDLREHIQEVQSDPLVSQYNIEGLSLSVGVSCYPIHGEEPSDLLRAADHALYYSKNHGRNQVRIAPKEITGQLNSQPRRSLSITDWLNDPETHSIKEPQQLTDRIPLVIGTNNMGKLREIQEILSDSGLEFSLELFRPNDLGINLDVDETGSTYAENAGLKVQAFYARIREQFSKFIIIADDSGLEVDALDGKPGIRSARYAPIPNATDGDRRRFLLRELKKYPQPWNASFQCTLAMMSNLSEEVEYFTGVCHGQLIPTERGDSGFGYDPIFFLTELGKTMAELPSPEKNSLSHRGNALRHAFPRMKEILEKIQAD